MELHQTKISATYQNEETTYGIEEIFTNHIANKGLIYKYIKKAYKWTTIKQQPD